MSERYFEEDEKFQYPDELRFTLRSLVSPVRVRDLIAKRKEYMSLHYPALRPINDRGGSLSIYSGPDGPTVTIAKMINNVSHGKPAGEGIPPNALNDPNSP